MTGRGIWAALAVALLLAGCGADGAPQADGASAAGQNLASRVFGP